MEIVGVLIFAGGFAFVLACFCTWVERVLIRERLTYLEAEVKRLDEAVKRLENERCKRWR